MYLLNMRWTGNLDYHGNYFHQTRKNTNMSMTLTCLAVLICFSPTSTGRRTRRRTSRTWKTDHYYWAI